jgi:hypothetical protein
MRNPDGRLNKIEFVRLYNDLRSESIDKLEEISEFVFSAFDRDNSKIIIYFLNLIL